MTKMFGSEPNSRRFGPPPVRKFLVMRTEMLNGGYLDTVAPQWALYDPKIMTEEELNAFARETYSILSSFMVYELAPGTTGPVNFKISVIA